MFSIKNIKFLRYILFFLLIALLIIILISLITTYIMLNPRSEEVKDNAAEILAISPEKYHYESVNFNPQGEEEINLAGWYLSPAEKESTATVIVSHGYGGNRTENIEVSEFLLTIGYSVLLFDFRNAGNSSDSITTVGELEKRDLAGAVDFIIDKKGDDVPVALLGYSMGAATSALVAAEREEIDAVVMDSSFADLTSYLQDNLANWTNLPDVPFSWLVYNFGLRIFDLNPQKVNPLKAVEEIEIPIFFIHGKEDSTISKDCSEKLFLASDNPEDKLWLVPEATHIRAAEVDYSRYTDYLTEFFAGKLK